VNYLYLGLLLLSLVVIEVLIGGTRLLFSLPSYGIISLAAVSTLFSFRRPQFPAGIFCLGGTAVFIGYILVRSLVSPVEYLARPDLFSALGTLAVYLLVALYLIAPKHRLRLLLGLLVIGLVQVGIGALQYLRREHFQILSFIQPADYGARASGFYICPDHLAVFLELVALMGLSAAFWSRWPHWLKACAGYASLMCFLGIVLTGSRGGYLSTGFGLLVFVGLSIMTLRKGVIAHKWPLVVGLVLATTLLVGGVTYLVSKQFTLSSRWNTLLASGDDRFSMWSEAIDQFKLSPATGTGSGTYFYYQRHFRKPHEFADATYAHNDYLHLLAEYGLIGFAAFLLFLGTHLVYGLKTFRWLTTERMNSLGRIRSDTLALNIGALSAMSTYLVHSVFDFNLHIPANALLLAIVFGMLANPGVEVPFMSASFHTTNRYLRLALPVIGIWLGIAGLPRLPGEYFAEQARVAVVGEKFSAAGRVALEGLHHESRNPYLYMYLGQGLSGLAEATTNSVVAENGFKAAVRAYKQGLVLFPQDRDLLLGVAWSLDGLKHYDEAESYFKEVMASEPNSAQVHAYYAAHLHSAGKLEEAEATYNKSLKLWWTLAAQRGLERLASERKAGNTSH